MGDTLLKRVEISFRRGLVRTLGIVVRRTPPQFFPADFNRCKFLFVRQDMIGDVLVATPLFHALKRHYPEAIVDVLLSTSNYFVLENEPLVRRRWVYKKNPASVWRLFRDIRQEEYDFAIDLMDNPSATSTLICFFAGAKWNVGIEKENDYIYSIKVPMLSRKDTHIVDRIAQLLTPFKIDVAKENLEVRYHVSRESEIFAAEYLRRIQPPGSFVIGLNVSAGSEVRFWGTANYRALLHAVRNRYPEFSMLILCKPSDLSRAKEIAASFDAVFVSPETSSFDQFAALVRRVDLLVTPDTSAVHLASAFKIPSVVLYVQSNKDLRIWDPYHIDSECIVTDVDDLTTISPQRVFDSLKALLERTQAPGAGIKAVTTS